MRSERVIEIYREVLPEDVDMSQIMLMTNLEGTEYYLTNFNLGVAAKKENGKTFAITMEELFKAFGLAFNAKKADKRKALVEAEIVNVKLSPEEELVGVCVLDGREISEILPETQHDPTDYVDGEHGTSFVKPDEPKKKSKKPTPKKKVNRTIVDGTTTITDKTY